MLLDALARHGHGLEHLSITLVGDGRLRADLERRAGELGLTGRIRFAGALTEHEVRDELARADLFVLPSVVARDGQMEGLPVALMEAMACGVPVVSTELSGIPELVRPGETGVLAPPGDAAGLAGALRSVLADPDGALERAGGGARWSSRSSTSGLRGPRWRHCFQESRGARSGKSRTRS